MFYSQFILAKKGPLGTIWIAAHLERKLRKNQVADTDIGVSVDSILFPEVPIALRLSSHLLLGVVRIYSRKVNYLFNDCSEALLKIKQAFRSTAVDLPPEESTAPYHSITLPETFDLDDFELPDFGYNDGNYVDHHISSREQITLQDTMDDIVFSTSQFGLDERFGDGGASQICLDFEEDFFLEKDKSAGQASTPSGFKDDIDARNCDPVSLHDNTTELEGNLANVLEDAAEIEDMEHEISDACQKMSGSPLNLVGGCISTDMLSDHVQTPELNKEMRPYVLLEGESTDQNGEDCAGPSIQSPSIAQAPSTPGLTEEVIPANVQEVPSLSHSRKDPLSFDESPVTVSGAMEASSMIEDEFCETDGLLAYSKESAAVDVIVPADGLGSNLNELVQEPSEVSNSKTINALDACTRDLSQSSQPGAESINSKVPLAECHESRDNDKPDDLILTDSTKHEQSHLSIDVDSFGAQVHESIICNECSLPRSLKILDASESSQSTSCSHILVKCSLMSHPECSLSTSHGSCDLAKGDHCLPDSVIRLKSSDQPELEVSQAEAGNVAEASNNRSNSLPESVGDPLLPEKMRSVPEEVLELSLDAGDKNILSPPLEGVDVLDSVSGKKRPFSEVTYVLSDDNEKTMAEPPTSQRTSNFVPNDDDILASILVGRRTPVFRIKPTPSPTPTEDLPSKRQRKTSRGSSQKRKTLLDDSMVLHGDMIRQQLVNTEDIRRLRKKAPCTFSEIWRIDRANLVDENFHGPLLPGMQPDLVSSYNRILVLSEDVAHPDPASEQGDATNFGKILETSAADVEDVAQPVADYCNPDLGMTAEHPQVEGHINSPNKATAGEINLPAVDAEIDAESDHSCVGIKVTLDTIGFTNRDTSSVLLGDKDTSASANGGNTHHADITLENSDLVVAVFEKTGASVVKSTETGLNGTCEPGGIHGPTLTSCETVLQGTQGVENSESDDQVVNGIGLTTTPCDQPADLGSERGLHGNQELHVSSDNCLSLGIDTSFTPMGTTHCHEDNDVSPGLHAANVVQNDPKASLSDEAEEGTDCNKKGSSEVDVSPMDISFSVHPDVATETETAPVSTDLVDPMAMEGCSESLLGNDTRAEDVSPMQGAENDLLEDFGRINENDTEFLNVDDEVDEEYGVHMTASGEDPIVENTGWSTRTRGVAKYLKSLFETMEAKSSTSWNTANKAVPLDFLLSGKTRKEASRMFFETLVLKTRDYIGVEQARLPDSVNISPCLKLMKSEF